MMVIANVFLRLPTFQELVGPLSTMHRFKTSFDSQHVKESQTLLKSAWEHFYHTSPSLWVEMIWKEYPLLKFKILPLFLNTLTADDRYPVRDCWNLQFHIQMIWSKTKHFFLRFFSLFWNVHHTLNILKKRSSSSSSLIEI